MDNRTTKQVIIIRTDLRNKKGEKIRTGKIISQGSHAVVNAIFSDAKIDVNNGKRYAYVCLEDWTTKTKTPLGSWMEDEYSTKICLKVKSEKELLDIYNKAKKSKIPCSLIKDAGLTEFSEPTYTSVAIGPYYSDKIDEITKNLSLL